MPNVTKSAKKSKAARIPGQDGYTKIHIIKSKPNAEPSREPAPAKDFANFPALHERSDTNSKDTSPQLYTVENPYAATLKYGQSCTDKVVAPPEKASLDLSLKPVSVESWPFTKDKNPLQNTHDFQMFCSKCFPRNFQKAETHANCLKNVLAFAEKGTHNWLQVRERRKHKFSAESYTLCKSLSRDPSLCKFGNEDCSLAHNTIEMLLWNADKQEKFDLTRFIYSHSTDEYRIFHFTRKYGTNFSYICSSCFKSSNLISYKSEKGNVCNGLPAHNWASNKTLFYTSKKKLINKSSGTRYLSRVCFNRNCRSTCSMAHSIVEREVWMLLHDMDITEEKFLEVLNRCSDLFVGESNFQQIAFRNPCRYKFLVLCKKCSLNGQNITHKQCGHSRICSGAIYKTIPGLKQINNLPNVRPRNYKFTICRFFKYNKCNYQGHCTYAHSQEEIDVWQWMCFNKITSLEEITSYQEKQSTEMKGAASVVQELLRPAIKEFPVPHYCQFCDISCRNQMEWDNHCTTNEHGKNVSHDHEQQWNYREPPWNFQNEKKLELCKKHERGRCLYSNSLDMHNLCPYAHEINELEEWEKRFEWRALKMDLAKKPDIMSYIAKLQETCFSSRKPVYVMSETILDVQLEMDADKKVSSTNKTFSHTWTITVTSPKKELQKVSLLHDKDRLYFTLTMDCDENNFQVLDAYHCKQQEEFNRWKVTVNYNGNMYGSFSQRVIFDFGEKPLLFRDLAVDVGTYEELQQLVTIRDKNNFELWTPENREIVFLPRTKNLINKYKRPSNIVDILNHDVISTKLNRHNYVQKMHKLLFLEEFACHEKMSRYNLCGDMIVSNIINDGTTFLSSGPGKLFGELQLSDELSEDTDIGQLILTSCTSVYIALPMFSSKVYQVEIVKDDNVNFKGHQRTSIYLLLTKSCIQDFGLTPNVYPDVELQFQLNRQSFILMHVAIDSMDSIDIVFPDPVKNVFSQKIKPTKYSSEYLNEEQLIAVKYIVSQRENFPCPFILNGAYGTGKTETLAQGTMYLLDTQPKARILICTQCNSSADLFILKHLDKYVKKQQNQKMLLRVYYSGRRVVSVPEEVRKYTLMSSTQDQFRKAQKTDFDHVRVVISTLENCHELIKLQLKGMFTHIFIDEAAQEFEARVLLPLSLATKDTCVVLSGDHHQMGVKVHSTEARQQGLGVSIMQRLFKHYTNHPHQNVNADSPLHTLLVHNYRSVNEINQFISTCFYGTAINHHELKTLPSISGLKPLQFYAVSGVESHYQNSPSYFNEKEVIQIVDCVVDMASNWPKEFGSFNPKSICIVSSYKDQVNLIRRKLRKECSLLSEVVVEQVGNVPGKEFDVIIISTVRTSKRLDINPEELANYCNETDEVDFFVNKKLLNMAMTRAKYSIIVVGDPVALCAYGKCATIWRIFINYCSKLCSVKPPEITYDVVRLEVSRLLYTRERFIQQADATCVQDSQLKTEFNFPIKSSISSLPDPLHYQEIHKNNLNIPLGSADVSDCNSHSVSPNPIQQVPVEDSILNNSSSDINQVYFDPKKCLKINPVNSNPKVSIIPKTECSNHVSSNPIHQVPIPITKTASPKVFPGVPFQNTLVHNPVPNFIPQVPIPITKTASPKVFPGVPFQNTLVHNPVPNFIPQVPIPITKTASPKVFPGVPFQNTLVHNPVPNLIYQVPIPITKTASPKVFPEVQFEKTCVHNPVPEIEPMDYISKNTVSSKTSSNLDHSNTSQMKSDSLNKQSLKLDFLDSDPKDSSLSKMVNPDILKLAWNQPYPLHYSKSRIDALFSLSKNEYCSEGSRIDFSFPCVYVIDSPAENLLIGLSFYKVAEHFIVGIHWPDLQSYIPNEKFDDIGALETVLALGPKQSLPNVPELYFTLDRAIGAVSCLLKVDIQGKVLDCSFHQTFIKPEKIIPITELENYLQRTTDKQELNLPNYLHRLANIWCKLRLGNESLYFKNPYTDHPKSYKLLTEICIQVHIQIVRYLSKVFPETTPRVWQSFQNGSRLDQWKREHVSDALNAVLLLQPYLHGKICRCETFCECFLDYIKQENLKSTIPKTLEINSDTWKLTANSVDENQFGDLQDIIQSPFCHNKIIVALKKLAKLTEIKFGYSNNIASDYSLNFDPQVYLCKPSISFLDLLVQKMLVAAIHKLPNPVNVKVFQKVTQKLTETIAAKRFQQ